jgi:hypothetical protein
MNSAPVEAQPAHRAATIKLVLNLMLATLIVTALRGEVANAANLGGQLPSALISNGTSPTCCIRRSSHRAR